MTTKGDLYSQLNSILVFKSCDVMYYNGLGLIRIGKWVCIHITNGAKEAMWNEFYALFNKYD